MATGDRFFGFDQLQRKSLAALLVEAGLSPEQAQAVQLVASLPTEDPEDGISVWNNNGQLRISEAI